MVERQSSEQFALGRQESVLEPGYVRPPKDMAPPTPVEWGRGDSLMWESKPQDNSTPLAGYGREKDLFTDAVATLSPNTQADAHFPREASHEPANEPSEPSVPTPAKPATAKPESFPTLRILSAEREQMAQQVQLMHAQGQAAHPQQPHGSLRTAQDGPPLGAVGDSSASVPAPGWGGFAPQQHQQSGGGGATRTEGGAAHHHYPYSRPGPYMESAQHPRHQQQQQQQQQNAAGQYLSENPITRQTTSEVQLAAQFRSPSQIMTDEMMFQAKTFPPPPPIIAPQAQRRNRAARWYYYATKWDITHVQPPPPRSPLPQMDYENANPNIKSDGPTYPYRGEYWLDRCLFWFREVQKSFVYPSPVQNETPVPHVMDACVTE